MDKSELYSLVFIALFLVFYSTLASNVLSAMDMSNNDIERVVFPNYHPSSNITNYKVTNGVNSSNDGQSWYNVTEDYERWEIEVTGNKNVEVWIYDGFTDDENYINFQKYDEGAWLNTLWNLNKESFSKNELYDMITNKGTDTQITFNIQLEKVFQVSLVSYASDTIYNGIGNNEFVVFVGEYSGNVTKDKQGAFDSFVALVTFNIPDMPEFIGFIIASPIYILGTYLGIRVVLMFLPMVSGGA